jgi:hypothetical protein
MSRYRYNFGLVFLALALAFAFSPTQLIPDSQAGYIVDEGQGPSGGGKGSGDPDMPDTQPPPPGSTGAVSRGSHCGGVSWGYCGSTDAASATEAGRRATFDARSWLQGVWQALRVQFGWI